ncbi:MAG: hypothetical protein DRJ40_01635 [Thermoprotei archaeon]|nr:MAG: hypothetical protein DRJ40_01635 [Thermoprotei archaeon]
MYQIWNLDREAHDELLNKLKTPLNHNQLWQLTGGNPRAIYELHIQKWNIGSWLQKIIEIVKTTIKEYCREKQKPPIQVLQELKQTLDNIDELELHPIWDYMLRNNIVTPLYSKWLDKKPSKTYWIGEDTAYQLPAHYWTIRTMVQKQTLNIEPKDIIQEIREEVS